MYDDDTGGLTLKASADDLAVVDYSGIGTAGSQHFFGDEDVCAVEVDNPEFFVVKSFEVWSHDVVDTGWIA